MLQTLSAIVVLAMQPGLPGLPSLDPKSKPAAKTPAAKSPAGNFPKAQAAGKKKKNAPAKTELTPPPVDEAGDDEETADEGKSFSEWLDEVTQSGAIGYLREGGVFMYPILLLAVIAFGVMIERYRSLKMLAGDSGKIRSQVRELLEQDRVEEALELCDREEGPVPAILAAGLRKYVVMRRLNYDRARIEEQVIKAMDDYSVHVVAALEKHLPILATVSSAAPMLGFLGTVAGMITSFKDIVAQMGETNIVSAAAGGISVALLTTAFGLIVGIPAFMAFNYFSGVINRFVLEVEESATELIEVVSLEMAMGQRESDNGTAVPEAAASKEATLAAKE